MRQRDPRRNVRGHVLRAPIGGHALAVLELNCRQHSQICAKSSIDRADDDKEAG